VQNRSFSNQSQSRELLIVCFVFGAKIIISCKRDWKSVSCRNIHYFSISYLPCHQHCRLTAHLSSDKSDRGTEQFQSIYVNEQLLKVFPWFSRGKLVYFKIMIITCPFLPIRSTKPPLGQSFLLRTVVPQGYINKIFIYSTLLWRIPNDIVSLYHIAKDITFIFHFSFVTARVHRRI